MKSMLALITFFVVQLAVAAGSPLAVFEYNPGFEMNPVYSKITVSDDGKVEVYTKEFRTGIEQNLALAELEPVALMTLSNIIGRMKYEVAKDQQAGEPMCTDTPALQYYVFGRFAHDGMMIHQQANCHTFKLESYPNSYLADQVKQVLDGLRVLQPATYVAF